MAHELDITEGQVSFVNSRTDAWHRLGQSVGHAMTAREALDAADPVGLECAQDAAADPARTDHHRRRRRNRIDDIDRVSVRMGDRTA